LIGWYGTAGWPTFAWMSSCGISGMSRGLFFQSLAVHDPRRLAGDRADLRSGERLVPLVEELPERVDPLGR
jgi:hypothetical protein